MELDVTSPLLQGEWLPALALLAPGFLVLYLIQNFRGRRMTENALVLTLASVVISGFLGLLFMQIEGLRSSVAVVSHVVRHPGRTAGIYGLLIIGAAITAAAYEEYNPIRRLFHWVQSKKGAVLHSSSTWDSFLHNRLDYPVIVESRDGRLYGGFLRRHSEDSEGERPALVLVSPVLLSTPLGTPVNDLDGAELGTEVLLQAEDIRTITVVPGPLVDGTEPE